MNSWYYIPLKIVLIGIICMNAECWKIMLQSLNISSNKSYNNHGIDDIIMLLVRITIHTKISTVWLSWNTMSQFYDNDVIIVDTL